MAGSDSFRVVKPALRSILLLVVALSTLDMVWVLFLGGVNVGLGALTIRSTTIEFPLVVFLVAGILLLVACGKPREALLACGSVVVAAVLAEAALQVLDPSLSKPHVRAWYEPSDLFGHRLVANFEGFGPLRVPIRTNAQGFRDEEHAWDKDAGTVRILGLGDSFMFGWGVASEQAARPGSAAEEMGVPAGVSDVGRTAGG